MAIKNLLLNSEPIDLASLLSRAREAFFVLNERGDLVFANRALLELLELTADDRHRWERAKAELLAPPADLPAGQARWAARPWEVATNQQWLHVLFLALADEAGGRTGVFGQVGAGRAPSDVPKAIDSEAPERLLRHREEQRRAWGFETLPAKSEAAVKTLRQVRLAIGTKEPVALIGESGAGKESLARLIHFQQFGAKGSLAILDCRALPMDIQHQQLMGRLDLPDPHSPQAMGMLRAPGSGTLLLKGPFDLSVELQKEVVRAFENPAGQWRLAVTERLPLEAGLADGRLTESFYHLVSALVITVPPLRERRADLADCSHWILNQLAAGSGAAPLSLEPAALELIREYDWPGNLRELHSVLTQASQRASGGTILRADLPRRLRRSPALAEPGQPAEDRPPPLKELLENVERRMLRLALERSRGNKAKAAKYLRISRARFLRRWEVLHEPTPPKTLAKPAPPDALSVPPKSPAEPGPTSGKDTGRAGANQPLPDAPRGSS